MDLSFCRRCGNPLTTDDSHVYRCETGHTIYRNAAPTASAFIITSDGNVLLGRRGIEPFAGALDSIGGFVDWDETSEQGVIREIEEEVGLKPNEYSSLQYLCSSVLEYPFKGEKVPVLSANFYAYLLVDRELTASDDIVEIVNCPIDEETLQQIEAQDVQMGFRALIEQKERILNERPHIQ